MERRKPSMMTHPSYTYLSIGMTAERSILADRLVVSSLAAKAQASDSEFSPNHAVSRTHEDVSSVNIPWSEHGMGDADYIHAFQKIVMPIAMEFAPELVIISAGFDAALGDELGGCCVSPAGYAHMTHMLSGLASGRLVVALEGGYNIDATTKSAMSVLKVILGEAPDELPPLVASESGTEVVWLVAKEQSKYWKSVDPKWCEPREAVEPMAFSIPEILKAHRQHYLCTTHNMMTVPLLGEELERKFSSQIMCSQDLFENDTMVVFLHEFGNLRTELESAASCDVKLEKSYLVDFSKELISWIKEEGYSLLDVNLFPKPTPPIVMSKRSKPASDHERQLAIYLWDNYIQLSSAQKIVLVGHGPGGHAIMGLLDGRMTSAMNTVRAVIQVVGHANVPAVPKFSDDLRKWYAKNSYVVLPARHRVLGPEVRAKDLRRHGNLCPIGKGITTHQVDYACSPWHSRLCEARSSQLKLVQSSLSFLIEVDLVLCMQCI
ncbi:Histone deacetylase hda1 [Marasmius tenuissimus]|nr:Histone deacetylase hda1 [Marasmius tenuissimus]